MIVDENLQRGFSDGVCEPKYYKKGILRPKLMSAADYVFYLRRHLVAERRKNDPNVGFPGDENLSAGIPRLAFLLRRLEEDIQSSYLSFLEEFSSEVHDGIGCLLNILRTCLSRQKGTASMFPYATCGRGRQNLVNKGTIDEFYCLLCLKAATRSSVAVEQISNHKTGLSTVATCIMSSHMKSRVIAIELLTITCKIPELGVANVLEAMTTVRIIFGESVRFKFLVSMLNSNLGSNIGIEIATMSFLNTLLDQMPKLADRVRIQCELEEAGFSVQTLQKNLNQNPNLVNQRLRAEIEKWQELQVDLQNIVHKQHENMKLKKEVQLLRRALKKLQEERSSILTIHKELQGQWVDMEQRIKTLALKTRAIHSPHDDDDDEHDSCGDSLPTSESSGFQCGYNKSSSSQVQRIPPESHDSELEEILIDIPTIQPGSIFEIRPESSMKRRTSNNRSSSHDPDIPPPLPPNHPKLSDSGISSSLQDSDADINIDWHYPEIPKTEKPKHQLNNNNNTTRVRFSESIDLKPSQHSAEKGGVSTVVILPPGRNKTKCADIVGVQNCGTIKNSNHPITVQNTKKLFSTGFNKNKDKKKSKGYFSTRSSTAKKSNSKLWNNNSHKTDIKAVTEMGSSLNGMIHREIAKAIQERNALFQQ